MEFTAVGDLALARGINFEFVKVGDKCKFTFTGKVASRRVLRTVFKEIVRFYGGE